MTCQDRPGYALIAVLIVVVVLSLAAYRFADSMTAEYQVAVRSSEAAQARAFAVSGVYYAAGAVSDPNTLTNTLGGNPYDNQDQFGNVSLGQSSDPRGGGRFSLMAVADTYTGSGESRYQIKYGVLDESAKLNINALIQQDPTGQVLHDALMKLPNMTEDIADAIVDWVDPDENPRANGAESDYYQGLPNPYRAKNGPINSIDELLLVRGVTPQLLYGNDRNRNGHLDPGEEDGNDYNRGWSEFLTVYGRELDLDTNGNPRIFLNDTTTDPNTLYQQLTTALGQEMADYAMAALLYGTTSTQPQTLAVTLNAASGTVQMSGAMVTAATGTGSGGSSSPTTVRFTVQAQTGNNNSSQQTVTGTADQLHAAVTQSLANGEKPKSKISSIMSLYNTQVTLPKSQQQGQQSGGQSSNSRSGQSGGSQNSQQNTPTVVVKSPLNDTSKLPDLLPKLLDLTTTRSNFEITPRVNVNTAPPEVLLALPGLTQDNVDAIVAARSALDPTDPATTTGAWMVTQSILAPDTFNNLEKYVTGRTMTYRVQSVGYFGQGGPTARVEAVIDTNQGHPRIVYFRDLTDLGRAFDPPR